MGTKNNILIWLLIATILNSCCYGGLVTVQNSFSTSITISPIKQTLSLNDTIKVALKIPTSLYDSLSKTIVEYKNREIFFHSDSNDSIGSITNIFLSKDFDVLVRTGTKKEYVNAIQGVLLATNNDYYELSIYYIAKKKGKFCLYFNIEIPKFYKYYCNGIAYDVVAINNDMLKDSSIDFLKKNPTFKAPYHYYYYYDIMQRRGAYFMVEVQ